MCKGCCYRSNTLICFPFYYFFLSLKAYDHLRCHHYIPEAEQLVNLLARPHIKVSYLHTERERGIQIVLVVITLS